MPQLMPLPWILSCYMIIFLIFMMKSLYSKVPMKLSLEASIIKNKYLLWLW